MSFDITRSQKDMLDRKSLATELTDEDLSKVTGGDWGGGCGGRGGWGGDRWGRGCGDGGDRWGRGWGWHFGGGFGGCD